jgi:hypothetical protein
VYDPERRRMVQIRIDETKERVHKENEYVNKQVIHERKDNYKARSLDSSNTAW